jgi:hypothetical protein
MTGRHGTEMRRRPHGSDPPWRATCQS